MNNWKDPKTDKPRYGKPYLVYCGDTAYKWDMMKITIASFQSAKEIFESTECYESIEECKDTWVAETSLFDSEYGGRLIDNEVTLYMDIEYLVNEIKEV